LNSEIPIRAMGLHSLLYCERLHFLEEVEKVEIADERVYAGRTLHESLREIGESDFEDSDTFEYTSEKLHLTGKMDRLMKRDGQWIPYEHKRGRSHNVEGFTTAWSADAVQVGAYALLLEDATGRSVTEARIRYHTDNRLVKVTIDDTLRRTVLDAILRARSLQDQARRPPVTENSRLCLRCSLAPVCLPEENRISRKEEKEAIRLFPSARDKQTIHISHFSADIGRKGGALTVQIPTLDGGIGVEVIPIQDIESIVLHGSVQISAQVLALVSRSMIPVHWFTGGGAYVGTLNNSGLSLKRRLLQFETLRDPTTCLKLSKKIVTAKCESQIRYVLRCTRGKRPKEIDVRVTRMRNLLSRISDADTLETLRAIEGNVARHYFRILPSLLSERVDRLMLPIGRNRRPPTDPFNAILSFMYALLYKSVFQAITAVGLDPAFGIMHAPRSSAMPLVLDIMEIFRLPICDIPVIGSVNRLTWNPSFDFIRTKHKVWLSDAGRRKAVEIYENRLEDKWKHPILGYSLSYYRLIELEVRLLEKEWTGEANLFARARIR